MKKYLTAAYIYPFSLLVSLVATLGSLYYSEIVGLTPCELCWYQRILMYPLIILFAVGTWKKDTLLPRYVMPLSVLGILVSGYHYALQKLIPPNAAIAPCRVGELSCTLTQVEYFGFITIPLMAFTAFCLITIAMWISLRIQSRM